MSDSVLHENLSLTSCMMPSEDLYFILCMENASLQIYFLMLFSCAFVSVEKSILMSVTMFHDEWFHVVITKFLPTCAGDGITHLNLTYYPPPMNIKTKWHNTLVSSPNLPKNLSILSLFSLKPGHGPHTRRAPVSQPNTAPPVSPYPWGNHRGGSMPFLCAFSADSCSSILN